MYIDDFAECAETLKKLLDYIEVSEKNCKNWRFMVNRPKRLVACEANWEMAIYDGNPVNTIKWIQVSWNINAIIEL